MKTLNASVLMEALSDMRSDLLMQKKASEEFLKDIKDTDPEEVTVDEDMDFGDNSKDGEDFEEKDFEEKESKVEIKTPEDAKKVLNEAKEDLQAVIDNIEGVMGQGDEEIDKVAVKRVTSSYKSNLKTLSELAESAINDSNDALRHWAFLRKRIKRKTASVDTSVIQNNNLRQVANTLQELSTLEKVMDKLGFIRKGTAVPPTGAEFTGNKWPNGKNPAEVELRHWQAGADKFRGDNKRYNNLPNPAVDDRLIDAADPHDPKPFVNASYNSVGQYWDVYDSKTKKAFRYAFATAPSKYGSKNSKGLAAFASREYGKKLVTTVATDGILAACNQANGQFINPKFASTDNKSSVRGYYSKAYGDSEYAGKLTTGNDNSSMNIKYKPKDDKVENTADHPGFGKAKDGPGKISSTDKKIAQAKAEKGLEIARLAAAAGVIEFNKSELKKYAMSLMSKSNDVISELENTFNNMPIVSEAALQVEGTIPDADSGVVGNRLSGVQNPMGRAETEGGNPNVESDATISKKASIVPQMQRTASSGLQISDKFTTVESKLRSKGINLNQQSIRKAQYRGRA